eukprot:12939061-Prorocentrum_lima.AAC.1
MFETVAVVWCPSSKDNGAERTGLLSNPKHLAQQRSEHRALLLCQLWFRMSPSGGWESDLFNAVRVLLHV